MDTFSDMSSISDKFPLSEADQTALQSALLHDLGAISFSPGALISRTLWIIFVGA
jgi:hypothetical protein